MTEHVVLITDQSGLELIGIGGYAEGGDMDEPVTVLAAVLRDRAEFMDGERGVDPDDASRVLAALSKAGYVLVPGDSLDAAWRAAEAALGDGRITGLFWPTTEDDEWMAQASRPNGDAERATGPTPAEALTRLATLLQERKAGQSGVKGDAR